MEAGDGRQRRASEGCLARRSTDAIGTVRVTAGERRSDCGGRIEAALGTARSFWMTCEVANDQPAPTTGPRIQLSAPTVVEYSAEETLAAAVPYIFAATMPER